MMCNIVVINTAVVVARLYWFQKRFRHIGIFSHPIFFSRGELKLKNYIVQQSRQFVRTRSMPVSINDGGDEERAVGGRRIRVLLDSGKPMNGSSKSVEEIDPRD